MYYVLLSTYMYIHTCICIGYPIYYIFIKKIKFIHGTPSCGCFDFFIKNKSNKYNGMNVFVRMNPNIKNRIFIK